jgi:molecular chaperone DnaJ
MYRCEDLKSYYSILDLKPKASIDDIKRNYKKQALIYHPDRSEGDKTKEEHFKKIQEAYAVLSCESKRKLYDDNILDDFGNVPDPETMVPPPFNVRMHMAMHGDQVDMAQGMCFMDLNELLSGIFHFDECGGDRTQGGADKGFERGVDGNRRGQRPFHTTTPEKQVEVKLSLDDVINGCSHILTVENMQTCSNCLGEGIIYGEIINCLACNGRGIQNAIPFPIVCMHCGGNAQLKRKPKSCTVCGGKGKCPISSKYELNVPPGQADRSKVELEDDTKGVHNTKIVVIFRHHMSPRNFKLDSDGVIYIVEGVKIEELLCGFERDIHLSSTPTTYPLPYKLKMTEYFDINEVITLKNRGVAWSLGNRGDVKVKFKLQKSDKEGALKRYKKVFLKMFYNV